MLAELCDMSDMNEGEIRVYNKGDQQEAPEDAKTPVPEHVGPVWLLRRYRMRRRVPST